MSCISRRYSKTVCHKDAFAQLSSSFIITLFIRSSRKSIQDEISNYINALGDKGKKKNNRKRARVEEMAPIKWNVINSKAQDDWGSSSSSPMASSGKGLLILICIIMTICLTLASILFDWNNFCNTTILKTPIYVRRIRFIFFFKDINHISMVLIVSLLSNQPNVSYS